MRALILLAILGCATAAAPNQTVTFRSYGNPGTPPITVSVGRGHISGGTLNAWVDEGCIHGNLGRLPVQFCRDDKGDSAVQHWSGTSGEFTVRPSDDGQRFDVDGYWQLDARRMVPLNQTIPVGQGAQWNELRKNPGLLVIASTAADLQSVGIGGRF